MKIKFILTMKDAVVTDKKIDSIEFEWIEYLNSEEAVERSRTWITSHNFLTGRMTGLSRVGESQLTMEPLEE